MYISTIAAEDIERLDQVSFPGTIQVIDSVGSEFNNAIKYLKNQKIIGFDTETRPCFSASQPRYGVALLQLSSHDRAFLFRINNMGMHRRLCNLLSNDKVMKVGAAVTDDIRGLQKYSSFTPRAFVDLQKMVGNYGIKDRSVKKMTAIILGFRISKAQQLSNWEAETLSESQVKYAATDAWVCREMYVRLMNSTPLPEISGD
ncbi:MAG: 3'-5' exonuclease domain-containing protein 2 [Bacteroidetes bacterium]|uniref:3'-5' exonuclease n=1 Tax=Candidatus Cryptobacteroides excrementavium TaxID=2840759 RepID=A0A9D9J1N3_9BACT|nr:3'-5' exonuclease domain-containing protein 2 [Candidatus Cryptobacteroides excrementavium]